MRPFIYERVGSSDDAWQAAAAMITAPADLSVHSPVQFLAGGTTLIDLMKLDVMRPQTVVDINALEHTSAGRIESSDNGIRLGALVRMADAAEHPVIKRDYPVIAQSLQLAASPQLRLMASLSGNVLQRTRCSYFRDTSYTACNKREPGSGCAARNGINRAHAVLGTSDHCIATYPGDFAQAMMALDGSVDITGPKGTRTMPFAMLHRLPGDTPHLETNLARGELITSFNIPAGTWTKRSLYLKIRDRQSYEFTLASAAVALDLDMDSGTVRQVRIALGGVATTPWRAKKSEQILAGEPLDERSVEVAADAAFTDAQPQKYNAFKIALGKRTLIRALHQAAVMEL